LALLAQDSTRNTNGHRVPAMTIVVLVLTETSLRKDLNMSVVDSTLLQNPPALLLVHSVSVRGQSLRDGLADQWGPRQKMDKCINGEALWVETDTGEAWGVRCRRNDCLYCVRGKVARIRRAVRYSRPTSLLTLTALSGDIKTDAARINLLTRYLRRDGTVIRLVWAAECNPSGHGVHAHGWAYGDHLSNQHLNRRASDVGIGRCDVKQVRHQRNFGYIAKTATWNEHSLTAYRGLNGSELVHGRAFWRDPVTGDRLSLVRAAASQRSLDLAREGRR
jgi:hypothetical protein